MKFLQQCIQINLPTFFNSFFYLFRSTFRESFPINLTIRFFFPPPSYLCAHTCISLVRRFFFRVMQRKIGKSRVSVRLELFRSTFVLDREILIQRQLIRTGRESTRHASTYVPLQETRSLILLINIRENDVLAHAHSLSLSLSEKFHNLPTFSRKK